MSREQNEVRDRVLRSGRRTVFKAGKLALKQECPWCGWNSKAVKWLVRRSVIAGDFGAIGRAG